MTASADFNITKVESSRLHSMPSENIQFGKYFTDHMMEADYEDGEWKHIEIKPYQPLLLSPSLAALHYGQAIFEGIKAYKNEEGKVQLFRPMENFRRFNISAVRMEMPVIPEEIFMEGIKELVKLDAAWVPAKADHSLYIRPFMFASDEMIGVRPSQKYKFIIICSPAGPYFSTPLKIYVEEKYVRAVPGGVGYAKNAGNYGAAMFPSAEAKRKGYDQVLWMDAIEHKYVQECGTMNIFFIIGNTAITPDLESGTILSGVTRDSVITLLQDEGLTVEERKLSIDEIADAYKNHTLRGAFGTGTAATISPLKELRYKDLIMTFNVEELEVSKKIKKKLKDIRQGITPDIHDWMMPLD